MHLLTSLGEPDSSIISGVSNSWSLDGILSNMVTSVLIEWIT